VVVCPDLIAAPRRHRQPRDEREGLQELHSFVLPACTHASAVVWRP
jgi:hypothetical protein